MLNLGCGLDTSFSFLKNAKLRGVNIDFTDVIKIREQLLGDREDELEIMTWSDRIERVTKRGYMTRYRDSDKRYGVFANFLFKYVDRKNLSQIIEIEFKK